MDLKVWIDGKFLPKSDAKISVYDHGLLYGDGVFEGIRQYNGRVFEKQAHLQRLFESAQAVRLKIPYSMEQLSQALEETLAANKLRDSYIRLVVTRGTGYLGISPKNCQNPAVIIITDTIQMYPEETYRQGMAIITASTIRNHPNSLSPKVKSLNYLNNVMAKWEAIDAGVPEAVMLNHLGYVCECTGDNIFIVKNGELLTPPEDAGILVGITRQTVLRLARAAQIPAAERSLTRFDLYAADECFLTGTGAEIVPVSTIDNRRIGGAAGAMTGVQPTGGGGGEWSVGPITRRLMEAFHRKVREG
ncbi:MAG TPA: branched-chain-amino-acid transaminase [Phycisphaerae bacterium]|jgi:branched-chain amino acid aminotransferase|nr:branched-chain-amino-acid transaminase [Phycisphaerae bacterium]